MVIVRLKKTAAFIMTVLDIAALLCLFVFAVGFMTSGVFFVDMAQYSQDLETAQTANQRIEFWFAVVLFLMILQNKHPILKYIYMIFFGVYILAVPYYLHKIPSLEQAYTQGNQND